MKINVRQLMFALFAVLSASVVYAQTIKCNPDGQKLIKRITSDVLQIDGTVDPGSFNTTYEMTYFPNGRLKSVTLSARDFDNGGRFAERISIEADTFNIAFLYNGRKNPNQTARVTFNPKSDNGKGYPRIKTISRMTKEKDSKCDYVDRFLNIVFHERYRSLKIEMNGAYESVADMFSAIQDNKPEWLFTHNCDRFFGGVLPNTNLAEAGFKREICWFEDKDGYIYIHHETTEKKRHEQDGNLLSYQAEPNSRNLGDIFTDRINDTNLNLQFFFEVRMPELMTEWVRVRSKNLIKYEEAERINREIRYRKYWEYEYDSEGNVVGATVIRTDVLPPSKYRLKIEYVTE